MRYDIVESRKLLILTNQDDYLGPKLEFRGGKYHLSKLDLNRVVGLLSNHFLVECLPFGKLDLSRSYSGWYVIYSVSEERALFYQGYIEDILLRLKLDGAILLPDYPYFRAFQNKTFQEMLRLQFDNPRLKKPASVVVGRAEDLDLSRFKDFPYVVKMPTGASGQGVSIVRNEKELRRKVWEMSQFTYHDYLHGILCDVLYLKPVWQLKKWVYRKILHKWHPEKSPCTYSNTGKIAVQEYIAGDKTQHFGISIYYDRYYLQYVGTKDANFSLCRPEDTPPEMIEDVLMFAKDVRTEINVPMLSIDVAISEGICYLIEFDCINFSTSIVQNSEKGYCFDRDSGKWNVFKKTWDIEAETVYAITQFSTQKGE